MSLMQMVSAPIFSSFMASFTKYSSLCTGLWV